jgi:ABC-type transport system substrate-binding protein
MEPGSPWENQKIRWGVAMYNDISFEAWAPCCGGIQPTRWAAMDNPWFVATEDLTSDGGQFYLNFPDNTMDLEKATQYIREGKIELGLNPDEPLKTTLTIRVPDTAMTDIAERMVADLREIGIDAELVALDSAAFQAVQAGNFTGMVIRYEASGSTEGDSLFYGRYHSDSEFNLPGVSDPVLDEWILAGRSTLDPVKREKIYRDIQIRLAEKQYDWAVPNWTNEQVFPEWVKNPGPFTAGKWIQDMYLQAWVDFDHPSRGAWEWEK